MPESDGAEPALDVPDALWPVPDPDALAAAVRAVEEIATKLRNGQTLDQIVAARTPAHERNCSAGCAWVRTFDRALVTDVLRPFDNGRSGEPVPFERLATHPLVESVPQREGVYQVRDRPTILAEWAGPASEWKNDRRLVALSQDLVRYYHTRMEPLEVLYHQVVADPETARREFERQFPEAEERYDLTACDALVRAVDRRSVDGESGDLGTPGRPGFGHAGCGSRTTSAPPGSSNGRRWPTNSSGCSVRRAGTGPSSCTPPVASGRRSSFAGCWPGTRGPWRPVRRLNSTKRTPRNSRPSR